MKAREEKTNKQTKLKAIKTEINRANRKETRYSSTYEWIKKVCYTHRMECHSAIKKNEVTTVRRKLVQLEITLSEIRQNEKEKRELLCIFSCNETRL